MKIIRRLLIGVLVIVLIMSVGLVGWATVKTQKATERAAVEQQAEIVVTIQFMDRVKQSGG